MKRTHLIFLLILLQIGVFGQKGSIRGHVMDAETGEDLIGVNIVITGTYDGTSTDFDGKYELSGLDPGQHNLTFSFISFQTINFEGIEVKSGESTILNVILNPVFSQLNEVVIQAKAYQRTEAAMLTMQQKAATMIDGISTEQFSRLGDGDAAAALKRVIGVTVEEGKYVFIRGLGDRYTKTFLNGTEIPGLDPEKNTVQMDIFPGSFIENMVVHKTYSPDLAGDFSGGLVDIRTRDFPENFMVKYSGSLGYNIQASLNDQFLTYEGGRIDALGFNKGARRIPGPAKTEVPYFGQDNQRLDEVTRSFDKIMDIDRNTSFIDQSHSFSLGNQVSLFGKPMGFITGVTYKNEWSVYENGKKNIFKLVGANSETLNVEEKLNDSKSSMLGMLSIFLHSSLKFNNFNKLGFQFLYNHSGEKSARYKEGIKPSDDPSLHIQERNLEFLERSVTSIGINGEHALKRPERDPLKIEWDASWIGLSHNEPDLRFFNNDYRLVEDDTLYGISLNLYPVPARYFREMFEYSVSGNAHVSIPLNLGSVRPELKFGSSYSYKNRNSDERKFDFKDMNQSYQGSIALYLDDSNIGQDAEGIYGLFVENSLNTDAINSYTGYQNVYAGYFMIDVPFLSKFRLMTGIRAEGTNLFVENKVSKSHAKYAKGEMNLVDLLPAASFTYSILESMNLRLSYSKTIARPYFREIAPYAAYDFRAGYRIQGNPDIQRTLIQNFDIRVEWFFRPGEIISLSGFHKIFDGAIERIDNISAVNTEISYTNSDARVSGLEFEFRKRLDFTFFLKNISLGLNGALIRSSVKLTAEELAQIRQTDPEHPDTRVLSGQAPYIANAMVGYDHDKARISANLSYNISGPRLYLIVKGGTPDVFEQPRNQLDFNLSKKIKAHTTLSFQVKNILNSPTAFNYTYKNLDYHYAYYTSGISFKVGVAWSL